MRRAIARRAVRSALRKILTSGRVARLAGEAASNLVPGLDVVGDAAMIADLVAMAGEFAASKRDADAAVEFAKKGPRELDELRVDMEDKSFPSYDAFKKVDLAKFYGPAGDGYEYHHIVEQSAEGDIPASDLNSTRNIVRIPKLLHEEINSEYGKKDRSTRMSVRDELKGKSFEERFNRGLERSPNEVNRFGIPESAEI